MNDSQTQPRRVGARTAASPGPETTSRPARPGADLTLCCAEAQADGVPCPDLGRACTECERALRTQEVFPVVEGTLKLGI